MRRSHSGLREEQLAACVRGAVNPRMTALAERHEIRRDEPPRLEQCPGPHVMDPEHFGCTASLAAVPIPVENELPDPLPAAPTAASASAAKAVSGFTEGHLSAPDQVVVVAARVAPPAVTASVPVDEGAAAARATRSCLLPGSNSLGIREGRAFDTVWTTARTTTDSRRLGLASRPNDHAASAEDVLDRRVADGELSRDRRDADPAAILPCARIKADDFVPVSVGQLAVVFAAAVTRDTGISQNPVHGGDADLETCGDLARSDALPIQDHLLAFLHRGTPTLGRVPDAVRLAEVMPAT